ncbi:acyl-CoA dehydrogenase family protein, partial [Arthrobacter sp. TMN-49]
MHQVSELLSISSLLSAQERATQLRVREFVDENIRANIAQWYEQAHFPKELVAQMGALGLLGMHLEGYGCPGRSAVEYGLAALELEAGDSGLRTFVSVQGSLAMTAIHKYGSEEQKHHWLPRMAGGEAIGCFALTEAGAGSDPASMSTVAHQVDDSSDWIITGSKRWIGMASIADVAVVWAMTGEGVRGFLVPTDTPGFTATPIQAKLSMRISIQCDIELVSVRLPATAVLPHARGLRGPFECLNEARYGIAWGVMGAARDSLACSLEYSQQRQQFQKPLASFQLTQQKLVNMSMELEKGLLLALHLGRLKDQGTLAP